MTVSNKNAQPHVDSCVLHNIIIGSDFNDTNFTITLPPSEGGTGEQTIFHDIQQGDTEPKFMVIDDNVNEVMQSFALVAVVEDVPEGLACFRSFTGCSGKTGATGIDIVDNDGMSIEICGHYEYCYHLIKVIPLSHSTKLQYNYVRINAGISLFHCTKVNKKEI